jgi:hypothetical protein
VFETLPHTLPFLRPTATSESEKGHAMPLHYTAAASSRVTKPTSSSSPRRIRSPLDAARRERRASARASPSSAARRRREDSAGRAGEAEPVAAGPPAPQSALLAPLFRGAREQTRLPAALPDLLSLLHARTFDPALPAAPDGAAAPAGGDGGPDAPPPPRGLGAARLARALRVRAALPPLSTPAQLAALRASPTAAEREVAAAVRAGSVARVVVPAAAAGGGEEALLVRTDAWVALVRSSAGVDGAAGEKYCALLERRPAASALADSEIAELAAAGFLTGAPGRASAPTTAILAPGRAAGARPADAATIGSLASVAGAGARHASGTPEAGASSSLAHLGGGGARPNLLLPAARPSPPSSVRGDGADPLRGHRPSVPNTGPFLRLLADGRAHLLSLLARSGPHKSLPLERLREYWNGGLGSGVPAWRTRKWRDLHGLRLEWVLADCVGRGLVECFRTGSVGVGVRAT